VRGGTNTADRFAGASGAVRAANGTMSGVSVNSAPNKTAAELSATVPHPQIGVTTVGNIRAQGGDVVSAPTKSNPDHCSMCGLTPQQAESLFTPTIRNPHK
jgi:hypothetical protein